VKRARLSGSEDKPWRAFAGSNAPRMERNNKLGRLGGLLGHDEAKGRMVRHQSMETDRMNMEHPAFMIRRRRTIVIGPMGVIMVMVAMCVGRSMMVGLGVDRQGMDRIGMTAGKIVRMRRLGGGCASPDERYGHKDRNELPHEGHRPTLTIKRFQPVYWPLPHQTANDPERQPGSRITGNPAITESGA
jgi:hypothetical protein